MVLCIDSIMAQESSVAQGSTMEQLAEWCHFLRVEGSSNIELLNAFGWVQSGPFNLSISTCLKKKEGMDCNKYEEGRSKAGIILKILLNKC